MKTEYRSVGDGYCRWLEYKDNFRFLFCRISYWTRVPSNYWDEWMHEGISCMDHYKYVNSYDFDFDDFVKKYPDINDWLKKRSIDINRISGYIEQRKAERMSKNSGIQKY